MRHIVIIFENCYQQITKVVAKIQIKQTCNFLKSVSLKPVGKFKSKMSDFFKRLKCSMPSKFCNL